MPLDVARTNAIIGAAFIALRSQAVQSAFGERQSATRAINVDGSSACAGSCSVLLLDHRSALVGGEDARSMLNGINIALSTAR